jgi:hypothetical protein
VKLSGDVGPCRDRGDLDLVFGGEHIDYGLDPQAHTDGDFFRCFRKANVLVAGDRFRCQPATAALTGFSVDDFAISALASSMARLAAALSGVQITTRMCGYPSGTHELCSNATSP